MAKLTLRSQYKNLLIIFFKAEFNQRERFVAPILFAVTILLVFFFALGEINREFALKVFTAETLITIFLALQLIFLRIFEPEREDAAFSILRTHQVNPETWFLAKLSVALLFSYFCFLSVIMCSLFLHQSIAFGNFLPEMLTIGFLVCLGLSAVGVLLSAMMLHADAKFLLFPLLYFPLTTPVLLSASQSALDILVRGIPFSDLMYSWLGLLIIFDIIYLTISILAFGEIVKAE